ncbi:glycosyltransferase involved in cell wall biosynthesis [Nocardiopsis mwathae]|uniref:Glycosyltransferase involved in cell wall biosynthesis n=1 Tax=Nocardiopsis mwathae TaxID=1472723 RepID=A0A7W9YDG7_9ACTN|nr:glycosyltransferase family 4 protein [Nocardiopsis mwathae]MBB6170098.1 glycosyltransferase involved in cell wall biosynthesis [Nocardiopsis mwathae]
MRITLVGPAHPYKGGGARHTTELAHRLARRGHDVLIESWRAQYPALLYPGRQTIDVPEGEPFPNTRHELAWYRPDGWWRAGRAAGHRGPGALTVLTVFSPVQVPAYLGVLAGVGRRTRTVALCHNVVPHEPGPADATLMRALLRRVDGVLTHSPDQESLARGLARGADTRVLMAEIPPHLPETGGPPPAHPAEARRHHLLFFGIVRPYKGVDVLLRALARGAPPTVRLTVAGEFWGGSGDLRALAADLGIADRVEFREGYVPAGELAELFAAADAVVLPYRSATATQNVWLAHAHGVPVVATRAGTLPDHVRDGADGLLCAPDDAADLARALAEFYAEGVAERLRGGVRPVDPEPYWDPYVDALTAPVRPIG